MSERDHTTSHLIDAWTVLVSRLPANTISHKDGVIAMFGNVELPFFNLCTHERSLDTKADVAASLRAASVA